MKLVSIKFEVREIPLKTPFITALRRVEHVEFVRVYISTKRYTGVGEAPPTKVITSEDIQTISKAFESAKEMLLGLEPPQALVKLHTLKIGSSAKAALDMAIVSLVAHQRAQSMQEYFGVKDFRAIESDITISYNTPKQMLYDAKVAFLEHKHILKVKLANNIAHAVEVIKQISQQLPEARVLVDANQAWSLEESLSFIEEVADCSIELIEQPVPADDLQSLHTITNTTSIPILADEAVFSLDDVKKIIKSGSADMINIKLMKCGGVTKAVEILEYARKNGVVCMLGSMLEGPYSINMALYLAFAYRDVIKFVDLDSPLLYKELPEELDFIYEGCAISFKK